ncbi:MAG: sodium:solute symporter family protein [Phycisphaerae bacterium]|nr:sodium:solute symporter family protein [Phycisphaerae bacterium]
MYILGFHPIDVLVIVAYLGAITYVGKKTSGKVKSQEDFFMAGRSVGKLLQYFMNMATIVDASNAVNTASFAFSKGIGGVWLMLAPIFSGPYYWFIAGWFRRVRLITMAELFDERFKSKFLSVFYACVGIWLTIILAGMSYKITFRTFEAMTLKPAEKWTAAEKTKTELYTEYEQLNNLYKAKQLPQEKKERYKALDSMYKKEQIRSYISYTPASWFYIIYTIFVGAYVIMGGLKATVWNNVIQGLLVFAFSAMMIPIALVKLGGWSVFSERVPASMLHFFGSGTDEFSIWSIAAFLLANYIIGITGHQGNMAHNGSAKDEITARVGGLGGNYTKRILTIMWAICGLLAFALYGSSISDPDAAWGVMSNNLLGVGLKGVMIAGILAANMAALACNSIYLSALFVRNLYKPFVQNKSDHHYINVSRIAIAAVLLLAIYIAVHYKSLMDIIKMQPLLNIIFGAPVMLLLFWKRLSLKAVYTQVIVCTLLFAILPEILPAFSSVKHSKWLTQQTVEQTVMRNAPAAQGDVDKGLASAVGQKIRKEFVIPPTSIFFSSVARSIPQDANSPMVGIGRLNTELAVAKAIGLDLKNMKPATLLTIRYLVASFLPFIILIPVSLLTRDKGLEENIARFYVKMKTKVIPDHALDKAELEKSYANPTRFDHTKLFPNSSWEFCKWDKEDTYGVIGSLALTLAIVGGFWLIIKML